MNEQIKELAIAAGMLVDYGADITHSVSDSVENMEKFAKLIIHRCINEIETYRIPVGNSAAVELAGKWTYNALETIRDNIKEQFGVE